jgi:hypothetical protein
MQTLHFNLQGVTIEGTIIDVETVSLHPKPNGMFTLGTLSGSEIRIMQAETQADCSALAEELNRIWNTLPRPIYAYNRRFVAGWLSQAIDAEVCIEHDTMGDWKAIADQQAVKWPRLRELIRPPVFYYQWGIANFDRERDIGTMRRAMRQAKSVNEVISREALGGAPHIWWRQHLNMLNDPEITHRLNNPPADSVKDSGNLFRLPNGNWSTNRLAAIICHNLMDIQSQASLLLWHWNLTSPWL